MVAPSSGPDDALIGTVVDGRYKIVRSIGRGGMGRVYEGERVGIGRRVAIKLLDPMGGSQESDRARFAREATAAGKIDHPNCVGVSDFGVTANGTPYLVMDLVVGETLYDELERVGRMPVTRAFHITRHVLRGLRHAHGLGLVHRDITPRNIILVDRDGDRDFARLLDFGLAKPTGQGSGGDQITGAGFICGTPRYMAPEQGLGKPADERADLYALSIVLYEMLEGEPPFTADEALKVLMKHVSDPVPAMAPEVPRQVEALVRIGLAKNPDDRPQSADAYLAALDACAAGIAAPVIGSAPPVVGTEAPASGTAPTEAFASLPPQVAPKAGVSAATVRVGTAPVPLPKSKPPAEIVEGGTTERDPPAAAAARWHWPVAVGLLALVAIGIVVFAMVRRGSDAGGGGGGPIGPGTGSAVALADGAVAVVPIGDAMGPLDPYAGGTDASAMALADAGAGGIPGAAPWRAELDAALAEVRARHFDSAELALERLLRAYPDAAPIQLAVGHLNVERNWPGPALKEYRAAIARDPALVADPELIRNAIRLLDSTKAGDAAAFLERDIGAPAIPALTAAAEGGTSSVIRQRAREVLARLAP